MRQALVRHLCLLQMKALERCQARHVHEALVGDVSPSQMERHQLSQVFQDHKLAVQGRRLRTSGIRGVNLAQAVLIPSEVEGNLQPGIIRGNPHNPPAQLLDLLYQCGVGPIVRAALLLGGSVRSHSQEQQNRNRGTPHGNLLCQPGSDCSLVTPLRRMRDRALSSADRAQPPTLSSIVNSTGCLGGRHWHPAGMSAGAMESPPRNIGPKERGWNCRHSNIEMWVLGT